MVGMRSSLVEDGSDGWYSIGQNGFGCDSVGCVAALRVSCSFCICMKRFWKRLSVMHVTCFTLKRML